MELVLLMHNRGCMRVKRDFKQWTDELTHEGFRGFTPSSQLSVESVWRTFSLVHMVLESDAVGVDAPSPMAHVVHVPSDTGRSGAFGPDVGFLTSPLILSQGDIFGTGTTMPNSLSSQAPPDPEIPGSGAASRRNLLDLPPSRRTNRNKTDGELLCAILLVFADVLFYTKV